MAINPKISVIIPVYNVEQYVLKCVNSVISQDFEEDIEVILVDDHGSDLSILLLKDFISKLKVAKRDVRLIENPKNLGQAAARNNGVRQAKGEYLFFLDSDDYLPEDAFSILYNTIQKSDVPIVHGQTIQVDESGNPVSRNISPAVGEVSGVDIWEIGGRWHPVCWNKLIRKDYFLQNNLFFEEGFFYEDLYWPFLIAFAEAKIKVISDFTYCYTLRSSSTSHTLTQKHVDSFIKLIFSLKLLIESKNLKDKKYYHLALANFERFRGIAIDFVYQSDIEENSKRLFFRKMISSNVDNFLSMCSNPKSWVKTKIKIFPLYCGNLGHNLIIAKSIISKFIREIRNK